MLVISTANKDILNLDTVQSVIPVLGGEIEFSYGNEYYAYFHYDSEKEAEEAMNLLLDAYERGDRIFTMPAKGFLTDFARMKERAKYLDEDLKTLRRKKILSTRSANSLGKAGHKTLRSVLTLSEEQIASVPGIGEGSVKEIVDFVHGCGEKMGWEA